MTKKSRISYSSSLPTWINLIIVEPKKTNFINIYNTSKIPPQLLAVNPNNSLLENAGLLHNQFLWRVNNIYENSGFDSDAAIVGRLVVDLATSAEASTMLPVGSTAIITQGVADFLAAQDFNTGVQVWGNLFSTYKADPNYNTTALIGILSIAYYSSQYWEYAIENWKPGSGQPPTPTYQFLKIPKWLKVTLIDLAGGLFGAEAGATIGTLMPGVGNVAGACVGAVIGAAGASVEAL